IITNARTAEMAKLTENSFRDVNIAFANELSMICDGLDINVWELIQLANRHPRVNILQPGPGVGGHCIAVDPWFIVSKTPEQARLIRTAREVNDSKPEWVIEKVKLAITDFLQVNPSKTVRDITIACYGLAFKPDIDDLRESPSMHIAVQISDFHAGKVVFVEPNIKCLDSSEEFGRLVNLNVALRDSDIHVLLVDHKEFKSQRPLSGIIVDLKGIWLK
ncbi:UDP-N-acetyl-D-mannosamine dehydrogenase, partial [Vibrio cholerae]|uniref:UDP binding domain-containing protein n=1 Tax=Vibrio cholerae TaxID=666 RepID=UPI00116E22B6